MLDALNQLAYLRAFEQLKKNDCGISRDVSALFPCFISYNHDNQCTLSICCPEVPGHTQLGHISHYIAGLNMFKAGGLL